MKKYILLLITFLCLQSTYSQITYEIKNITVNNVAIPNNGSINFGANSSVVVKFTVQFTKPNELTIGNVSHVIGTYTNNGFVQLITPEFFTLGVGNLGFTGLWEKTLYASDYSYSGGNYLVSKLTQTTGTPPLNWESNHVPINRTPTFTLSPSPLSIPCGSTSSQTFTVSNSGLPPGATVSYNWFTGTGGWSGTLNNTNTITLNPASGTVLPSNISVVPVFNGINLPTLNCSVSRAAFTSSAAITGPTGVCSGYANYTISGIAAGQTVAWSLSNPSVGSLTNLTNTSATVSFTGNAAQTLYAAITNSCNQTITKAWVINTGATTFTSSAVISGTSGCAGSGLYTISNILAGQTVYWYLSDPNIATLSGTTNTQTTLTITGSGPQTLIANITNSCGQNATKSKSFYIGAPTLNTFTCGPLGRDFCSGLPIEIPSNTLPILDLNDKVTATFFGMTKPEAADNTNWEWQPLNSLVNVNGSLGQRRIGLLNYGVTGIQVRAKNACGWSAWYPLNFELVEVPGEFGKMSTSSTSLDYVVYPNPTKDVLHINLKYQNNVLEKNPKIIGELYDIFGIPKSKIEIKDNKAILSVKGLNKGIYILKIFINDKIETHQIAVE